MLCTVQYNEGQQSGVMHQTDFILHMDSFYKRGESHGICAALIRTEIKFANITLL